MLQVSCAVAEWRVKLRDRSASPALKKSVEDHIARRLERMTMVWRRKTAVEEGGEKET
jgi:hypothetical protein